MSAGPTDTSSGADLRAEAVPILYTNWRGETAIRRITPLSLKHDSSEWHPEPQWLLTAFDLDKEVWRDFAVSGIKAWGTDAVEAARARGQDPNEGTEWFWRIVDAQGLGNVPSDEVAALRILCERAARPDAPDTAPPDRGTEDEALRALSDAAGVTFDSSLMIEQIPQYGGPGALMGWHFSDPGDGRKKLSALIKLALYVRTHVLATPAPDPKGSAGQASGMDAEGLRSGDDAIKVLEACARVLWFDLHHIVSVPPGDSFNQAVSDVAHRVARFLDKARTTPPSGGEGPQTERETEAPIYAAFKRYVGNADERASEFRMFATGYHAALAPPPAVLPTRIAGLDREAVALIIDPEFVSAWQMQRDRRTDFGETAECASAAALRFNDQVKSALTKSDAILALIGTPSPAPLPAVGQDGLREAIEALIEKARPFAGAVFNDNGDVTISTGHIETGDWLRLRRAKEQAETALASAARPASEGFVVDREAVASRMRKAFPDLTQVEAECAAEAAFPECLAPTPGKAPGQDAIEILLSDAAEILPCAADAIKDLRDGEEDEVLLCLAERVRTALATIRAAQAEMGGVEDWRITAAKTIEAAAAEWPADGQSYAKTLSAIFQAEAAPTLATDGEG